MTIVTLERVGRQDLYNLTFDYEPELVHKIKSLTSDQRDWDSSKKIWCLTVTGIYNVILMYKGRTDILFDFGGPEKKEIFKKLVDKKKRAIVKKLEKVANLDSFNNDVIEMKNNLPELTKDLDYTQYLKSGIIPMQHQIEGAYFANYLSTKGESSLMAMDLGTGKTICSILAALMDKDVKKVLYIVPANLCLNIQVEVEKFTNEHCYVVKAKTDKKVGYKLTKYKRNKGFELDDCKFIVVSYDFFSSAKFDANIKISGLGLDNIDMIIFDEAHYISNKKSNRSENIKNSYEKMVTKRIALTATPVKSNVTNFFPILKMLKPYEFSNESKFFVDYCGMYYDTDPEDGSYPGWKQTANTNFDKLHQKLQTLMFRVKKEDVLKDLPPILINKILIEMTPSEKKEYIDIEMGFKTVDWSNQRTTETDDNDSDAPIVILTRLRQYVAMLKIKKAAEIIKELNGIDEKVILFDFFKKPIYALKKLLGPESKIYSGDQTSEQKQDLTVAFQKKDKLVMNLLISLMAGNAGITLTEAANVIQTTLSYVPSDNSQAYGRAHRIGQKRQVTVYILLMVDTIDEEINEILFEREKIIKAVIDGEEHVEDSNISIVGDLLKKMRQKYEL